MLESSTITRCRVKDAEGYDGAPDGRIRAEDS